ncbi:MAG: glycine C-acetyltransferase [Flavobacteriales bacterium]|nr:glycine C-acetyltransferase [Flavobacteriales bacterium]|tara:strand:- start:1340 stop:2524 length:1185 start_codon:yes stop_codon:yes gene_type:complete
MKKIQQQIQEEINQLRAAGLYKKERIITSQQASNIVSANQEVINLCANNYLGLSNDPFVIRKAHEALDMWGYGLSSVRFICGTQSIHKALEEKISTFLGFEDAILFAAAFDANGGLFEPLMSNEDTIISDELNHASIIDGIRLCKAKRLRYQNNNMNDLEKKLIEAQGSRRILIATDGVFSMDGIIANLNAVCDLADKYGALVMVDDSHATGFIGKHGKGSIEHCSVMGKVDILTGTFGKALGGASGGFIVANKEIIELLRQKSRPYLFSNSLAPVIAATTIEVINLIATNTDVIKSLELKTNYFRAAMSDAGFSIPNGTHPIVPVMLYDAKVAAEFADLLLDKGIYVISFSYPVVPKEKARIRVQISAKHTKEQLEHAIRSFIEIGRKLNVID